MERGVRLKVLTGCQVLATAVITFAFVKPWVRVVNGLDGLGFDPNNESCMSWAFTTTSTTSSAAMTMAATHTFSSTGLLFSYHIGKQIDY
jgi:hypothetical protein